MSHRSMIRSVGKIGLLTLVSRIFGYLRDASMAVVMGAGYSMDAFTIAFRLANLFRRLFGEGTMAASFIPVFTEFRHESTEKEVWNFVSKFFYSLALVLFGLVVLQIVFAPTIVGIMAPGFLHMEGKWELAVFLNRLMAPFIFFIGLSAVLMAVLNSFKTFGPSAASPIFFNLMVIFSAFTVAKWFDDPSIGIAIGVVFGGVFHFLFQVPAIWKKGMRFIPSISFSHPATKRIMHLMLPGLFGMGIVQINLLVDSLMASFLPEGSVSSLYYAGRIQELVLGIFTVSLATVILPEMSLSAARKDDQEMKETLSFSMRMHAFITVPATIGLVVLAAPIVQVLFQHGRFDALDTGRTAFALIFYSLGLVFIGAVRIIVPAFYAVQDTKTPVRAAFISLFVNVILNWILMHPLKQGGIALATSIAAAVNFWYLLRIYQKRFGPLDWTVMGESAVRILVQSLAMALACSIFLNLFSFDRQTYFFTRALALFGTIGVSIAIYFGVALIVQSKELAILRRPKDGEEIPPSNEI